MTEVAKRYTGKIVHLNQNREGGGYGFIVSKDVPWTRIYFHWSGLLQQTCHFSELKKGDELEFQLIEIPEKGWRAIRIDVFENENGSKRRSRNEPNKE